MSHKISQWHSALINEYLLRVALLLRVAPLLLRVALRLACMH